MFSSLFIAHLCDVFVSNAHHHHTQLWSESWKDFMKVFIDRLLGKCTTHVANTCEWKCNTSKHVCVKWLLVQHFVFNPRKTVTINALLLWFEIKLLKMCYNIDLEGAIGNIWLQLYNNQIMTLPIECKEVTVLMLLYVKDVYVWDCRDIYWNVFAYWTELHL